MQLPLRIVPANYKRGVIHVTDDAGRCIAKMHVHDLAIAKRIVRRENGWWYTLFGGPLDDYQRAYNRWIARNGTASIEPSQLWPRS